MCVGAVLLFANRLGVVGSWRVTHALSAMMGCLVAHPTSVKCDYFHSSLLVSLCIYLSRVPLQPYKHALIISDTQTLSSGIYLPRWLGCV